MKESTLQGFFEGAASPEELAADTSNAFQTVGRDSRRLIVETMTGTFALAPSHVVMLCDAVIAGRLKPSSLEAIAGALIASDRFEWPEGTEQDERVAEALAVWSAPEVHDELTIDNIRRWRQYLVTGRYESPRSAE